jgi:hypothetical protein
MTLLPDSTFEPCASRVPSRSAVAVNFVLFQLGWFACVLGAARGWPWAGSICAAGVAACHLWSARRWRRAAVLLLAAVAIGTVWDSIPVTLGWLHYSSGQIATGIAPHWIVALWLLFATTLNVSLRWLRGRYLLAAVLGVVAGPLAYCAGAELGALQFTRPPRDLAFLAGGWGLILPALVWLASRADGFAPPRIA